MTTIPLSISIVTVSDSRTEENDTAGQLLAKEAQKAGHKVAGNIIVPNNIWKIRLSLCELLISSDVNVIIINGGTGFTHDKATIPAVRPLLDNVITGFGELFRHLSYQDIGSSSIQSDAIAGLANNKLVFCIPGSPSACLLAWNGILLNQLNSKQKPCNFATMFK